MIAIRSFFRKFDGVVFPRGDVIAAHALAVEPQVNPNAVASIVSQDIVDVEARFDVEGPICWRDPHLTIENRERRRRRIAERHVAGRRS